MSMKPNITITLGVIKKRNCRSFMRLLLCSKGWCHSVRIKAVNRRSALGTRVGPGPAAPAPPVARVLLVGRHLLLGNRLRLRLTLRDGDLAGDDIGNDRQGGVGDRRVPRPGSWLLQVGDGLVGSGRVRGLALVQSLAGRIGRWNGGAGRLLADRRGHDLEEQVLVRLGVVRQRPAVDREGGEALAT